MKKTKFDVNLDPEVLKKYKEHLENVGYNRNKLFEKILEDFLKKNS